MQGGQRLAHLTNGSVAKGQGEGLGTARGTGGSVLTSEEEAGLGVRLEVARGDGFQKGGALLFYRRSCSSHPLLWTSLSFHCCQVCLPNMPLIHPRLCVSSATAVTTASPLHVATTDPHLLCAPASSVLANPEGPWTGAYLLKRFPAEAPLRRPYTPNKSQRGPIFFATLPRRAPVLPLPTTSPLSFPVAFPCAAPATQNAFPSTSHRWTRPVVDRTCSTKALPCNGMLLGGGPLAGD